MLDDIMARAQAKRRYNMINEYNIQKRSTLCLYSNLISLEQKSPKLLNLSDGSTLKDQITLYWAFVNYWRFPCLLLLWYWGSSSQHVNHWGTKVDLNQTVAMTVREYSVLLHRLMLILSSFLYSTFCSYTFYYILWICHAQIFVSAIFFVLSVCNADDSISFCTIWGQWSHLPTWISTMDYQHFLI